jgi:hypothetical protein
MSVKTTVAAVVVLIASVASVRAETKWITLSNDTVLFVDSEKLRWVQYRGTYEALGVIDGFQFHTDESADIKWLRKQTANPNEWIEVDYIKKGSSSFDRVYRWSAIRMIREDGSDLELWSIDQPLDQKPDIRVSDSSAVSKIKKLSNIK